MKPNAESSDFEDFARSIRKWLRHEAYRICGDWHESDDLVQVALCQVYQHWDRLERHAQLGAYSRRVLVRAFLTERRRPYRRYEIATLTDTHAVSAADLYASVDDRTTLLPALRKLGPRQRAVVTLRFLQDFSVEETAHALKCTPGTVTSQTVRGLENMRRLYWQF